MKKRFFFLFGAGVLLSIGVFLHSCIVVQRFDDSVFCGKGKEYFPEKWDDKNHMRWIEFVRSYRLNALERWLFERRVLRRMSDNPSRKEIIGFLTMTAEWQIYGEWNGHDVGGGVDFGRCEDAKPLLRKFLTEINEEEFRTRNRRPYHWHEGSDGIIYVSHLSTLP